MHEHHLTCRNAVIGSGGEFICQHVRNSSYLGENMWVILAAYFIAVTPKLYMSWVDFISKDYKSIKETRRVGYIRLAILFPCLAYLAMYLYLQAEVQNPSEVSMSAVALFYNAGHFLITLRGLWLLSSYKHSAFTAAKKNESNTNHPETSIACTREWDQKAQDRIDHLRVSEAEIYCHHQGPAFLHKLHSFNNTPTFSSRVQEHIRQMDNVRKHLRE